MSATHSAGALSAARRIYETYVNWRGRNSKAESAIADIIHEETQADTAALVAALKDAEEYMQHGAACRYPGSQSKACDCGLIEAQRLVCDALAKHGKGAES